MSGNRVLLDSNILIAGFRDRNAPINQYLLNSDLYISVISKIEILGYHKITVRERELFLDFIDLVSAVPISEKIVDKAIELRKSHKLKVPDSIIVGSSIIHGCSLATMDKHLQKIPEATFLN